MSDSAVVFGASGATGKIVVTDLIDSNQFPRGVKAVVRNKAKFLQLLPASYRDQVLVVEKQLTGPSAMTDKDFDEVLSGCSTAVSCLGHTLDFAGLFGSEQSSFVLSTVQKIVSHASRTRSGAGDKLKLIVMSTVGVTATDDEYSQIGYTHAFGLFALRWMISPHSDNERTAWWLRSLGAKHNTVKWTVVRPDTLIDAPANGPAAAAAAASKAAESQKKYTVFPSPLSNPLSNSGSTTRSNVAAFMARLSTDEKIFSQWHGKFPVIYDADKLPKGVTPQSDGQSF